MAHGVYADWKTNSLTIFFCKWTESTRTTANVPSFLQNKNYFII